MYMPKITSANLVKTIEFGRHKAELFDQIQAQGNIQYLFALAVTARGTEDPVLFVASEVAEADNAVAKMFGIPSEPFLGVFRGGGHGSYGSSVDWRDIRKFEARAVELVEQLLSDKRA